MNVKWFAKEILAMHHSLEMALIDIIEFPETAVQVKVIFENFVAAVKQIRDDLEERSEHPNVKAEMDRVDKEVAGELKALLHKERLGIVLKYKRGDSE